MNYTRLLGVTLAFSFCSAATAQVFVNDNFDTYADQTALEAVWSPDAGDGASPSALTIGELDTSGFPAPYDAPPLIDGQGIGNAGGTGVNENVALFDLVPSPTENIVVRGDIFSDPTPGNWRQMIGLRNDTIDREPGVFGFQRGLNFLEMGFWNADTCDPTDVTCDPNPGVPMPGDPSFIPNTEFAYRFALWQFGSLGDLIENGVNKGQLAITPNYQFFPLNPDLDLVANGGNGDGLVNTVDVGQGWHTYEATITETTVTLTLDLFRNGVNEITGALGPDSTVEIGIAMAEDPANPGVVAGMTSLRVGGPSGVSSNAPIVFDNLYLALETASTPVPGDTDGDGDVDLLDLDNLGANFGTLSGATVAEGDFDGDGDVDLLDLDILGANFGTGVPSTSVPEPSAFLLVLAASGLAVAWRRVQ